MLRAFNRLLWKKFFNLLMIPYTENYAYHNADIIEILLFNYNIVLAFGTTYYNLVLQSACIV